MAWQHSEQGCLHPNTVSMLPSLHPKATAQPSCEAFLILHQESGEERGAQQPHAQVNAHADVCQLLWLALGSQHRDPPLSGGDRREQHRSGSRAEPPIGFLRAQEML